MVANGTNEVKNKKLVLKFWSEEVGMEFGSNTKDKDKLIVPKLVLTY